MRMQGIVVDEKKPFEKVKFSGQRERIYKTLKNLTSHPTAEVLYGMLNHGKNKISFSTIYRNLSELVKAGKVHTLETIDDKIHYDADTSEHSHFICKECGAIIDVFEPVSTPSSLMASGIEVQDKKCVYYGLCADCNK